MTVQYRIDRVHVKSEIDRPRVDKTLLWDMPIKGKTPATEPGVADTVTWTDLTLSHSLLP